MYSVILYSSMTVKLERFKLLELDTIGKFFNCTPKDFLFYTNKYRYLDISLRYLRPTVTHFQASLIFQIYKQISPS